MLSWWYCIFSGIPLRRWKIVSLRIHTVHSNSVQVWWNTRLYWQRRWTELSISQQLSRMVGCWLSWKRCIWYMCVYSYILNWGHSILIACAQSEDSDQPAHPDVWSEFSTDTLWVAEVPKLRRWKTVIQLREFPCWSESSLGAHAHQEKSQISLGFVGNAELYMFMCVCVRVCVCVCVCVFSVLASFRWVSCTLAFYFTPFAITQAFAEDFKHLQTFYIHWLCQLEKFERFSVSHPKQLRLFELDVALIFLHWYPCETVVRTVWWRSKLKI